LHAAEVEVWKLEAEVDYHKEELPMAIERYKAARDKYEQLVNFLVEIVFKKIKII
jgi:hypothetical protein